MRVEPAQGAVLAAVQLHLPPALPAVRRTCVVGDASAFLRTARASLKMVAGHLNKAPAGEAGTPRPWARKAPWPGSVPRNGRDPTNVV